MSLHTRSLKYGKLRNGQLLSLPPRLVRRLKSHFYHLPPPCGPAGVDVILGLNGYVWVSLGTSQASREGGEGFDAEGVYRNENDVSGGERGRGRSAVLTLLPRKSTQSRARPSQTSQTSSPPSPTTTCPSQTPSSPRDTSGSGPLNSSPAPQSPRRLATDWYTTSSSPMTSPIAMYSLSLSIILT